MPCLQGRTDKAVELRHDPFKIFDECFLTRKTFPAGVFDQNNLERLR